MWGTARARTPLGAPAGSSEASGEAVAPRQAVADASVDAGADGSGTSSQTSTVVGANQSTSVGAQVPAPLSTDAGTTGAKAHWSRLKNLRDKVRVPRRTVEPGA